MAVMPNSVRGEHGTFSVAEKAVPLLGWLLDEASRIDAEKRIPEDVAQRLAAADR